MSIHMLQRSCLGKELNLPAGENRTIDIREPITVHCKSGMLWITVEGDSRDFFLRTGQTMNIVMHGKATIGAEERSIVKVEATSVKPTDSWLHDVVPLPNPLILNQPSFSKA